MAACQRRCSCLFAPCCLLPSVYKAHYLAAARRIPAPSPTEFSRLGHSGEVLPPCPNGFISHGGSHADRELTRCFYILRISSVLFFLRGKGNRCLSVVHPQRTRPYHSSKGTSGAIFASGSSLASGISTDIHPHSLRV